MSDVTDLMPISVSAAFPQWLEAIDFLGDDYMPGLANGHDGKVRAARLMYPDAETFYRETDIYIYHGIAYYLEGIKWKYYAELLSRMGDRMARILDYGAGTGDDGLLFFKLGMKVNFADVESRTQDFLRWRLEQMQAKDGYYIDKEVDCLNIYTIGKDEIPHHDIVWCMDVLEHLPPSDHEGFLVRLSKLADIVIVNLVSDPTADGLVHHPVDVDGLLKFAMCEWPHGLVKRYHEGRTHLLIYGERVETS